MLRITTLKSTQSLLSAAENKLSSLFALSMNDSLPTLFLSSGGSALNILEKVDHSVLSNFLTIGVLDERLSVKPEDSNFHNFSQTEFFKQAVAKGAKITRDLNPNTQDFKKIYITQGIGEDGHTAGIFPSNQPDTRFPLRDSVDFNFLKNTDVSIVYVVGENKKDALAKTLAKSGSLEQTPARIIHQMKQVYLFTDQNVLI